MQTSGNPTVAFTEYLDSIPNLHTWDKGATWNSGGFDRVILAAFHDLVVAQAPRPRIIETGAGNSTLCFLHTHPERIVSIAPDRELFERVTDYAVAHNLDVSALEMHVERSELALPRLVLEHSTTSSLFHFGLIDGGHGWPTVFVDFCYINALLAEDGLLAIDDIQLHSVKELARFLAHDDRYPLVADLGKVLVFRKATDNTFLPDFGGQPYILERSRAEEVPWNTTSFGVPPRTALPKPGQDERLCALEERMSRLEAQLAEIALVGSALPGEELPAALVLTADMYLLPGSGFHDAEHDDQGRTFRWTGPGTDFFIAGTFDRRWPCELRLDVPFANPAVPPEATRCFVDGAEVPLTVRDTEWGGWQLVATVPPRGGSSETSFHFVIPRTFAPPEDSRRLGLAFARFVCGPCVSAATIPGRQDVL
jgi:hypothetical protein